NFVDTTVTLGAHNMAAGQAYDVKVWTSLPNGANDPDKTNDSTNKASFFTGMSGTYTVGSGGDFKSSVEAAQALSDRGMCGNVTLSYISGTYNEQFALRNIRKADPSYSLTLTSQTGVASDVVLTYPTSNTGDNYLLLVEGVDHVVIENLTLQRPGKDNLAIALDIEASNDVIIRDNIIQADSGSVASNTTGSRSGIYSEDRSTENNVVITRNTFTGNSNGIWFSGAKTFNTGLEISNNSFSVGYTAVFVENATAPQIKQNYITRFDASTTSTFYGISVFTIDGTIEISRNEVYGLMSVGYGIRLREVKSPANNKGLVVNNMVEFNGSSTVYAYSL
ncbi:MAG: right-handed parallel beta-helix repeat-containing protein, partial [Bacteroidota bacterium]|nr:right-handed parallel beta-helix repeat-containing protein [Bacteroidota bacterium]MDX5431178.1 right-handed parallel beta-helix repeat-containing protein [Bacteroidota bacterium]MDX5469917.1 right-handed parallel beta-helix repeat-containing protein [Bacteroidota bacterium]